MHDLKDSYNERIARIKCPDCGCEQTYIGKGLERDSKKGCVKCSGKFYPNATLIELYKHGTPRTIPNGPTINSKPDWITEMDTQSF